LGGRLAGLKTGAADGKRCAYAYRLERQHRSSHPISEKRKFFFILTKSFFRFS
jgi:hypothetical protein